MASGAKVPKCIGTICLGWKYLRIANAACFATGATILAPVSRARSATLDAYDHRAAASSSSRMRVSSSTFTGLVR